METVSSRKNAVIRRLRALASDGAYRREAGEYVCDGWKTLCEALQFGARVKTVLWKGEARPLPGLEAAAQFCAPPELFDYASPLTNSPGPLFTVAMPEEEPELRLRNALVLENVQDPGNVGTVVRTANAFGIDAVILVGACADLYQPKTVRATMGAIFRQRVLTRELEGLRALLAAHALPLYGAALDPAAKDVRALSLRSAAVAVGSEGRGLSPALLAQCREKLIIPMRPDSESLNAAVAASVLMWEMTR